MKVKRKTLLNVLLFVFIISFFVTDVGYFGKIWLNRIFAFSPPIIEKEHRNQLANYNWQLKDSEWDFFSFERSRGNVVFINLWASWRLPCEAELRSIQDLYDIYKDKIDFYIITDEERAPVEAFMEKNKFTFPVTYLIIGEKTPIELLEPPASYIIDKKGFVVVQKEGISDWDSTKVKELLDELVTE